MKDHFLTAADMTKFERFLREEEREAATIEKYLREVQAGRKTGDKGDGR